MFKQLPQLSRTPGSIGGLTELLMLDDEGMPDSMLVREQIYHPNPNCLQHQKEIDPMMRAILIDWMIEVSGFAAFIQLTILRLVKNLY